jgi:hypothetical protein
MVFTIEIRARCEERREEDYGIPTHIKLTAMHEKVTTFKNISLSSINLTIVTKNGETKQNRQKKSSENRQKKMSKNRKKNCRIIANKQKKMVKKSSKFVKIRLKIVKKSSKTQKKRQKIVKKQTRS